MNELKQIRSMAELILEKVDALEGANPYTKDIGFDHLAREYEAKPKFQVGDRVRVGGVSPRIGTVAGQDGKWYVVTWDDYNYCLANPTDMHLVTKATKDDREWHSGPPPHVGWWNASTNADPNIWRWWNGTSWSTFCTENMSLSSIARLAAHIEFNQQCIKWTDYWPANAREPRIDPGVEL